MITRAEAKENGIGEYEIEITSLKKEKTSAEKSKGFGTRNGNFGFKRISFRLVAYKQA